MVFKKLKSKRENSDNEQDQTTSDSSVCADDCQLVQTDLLSDEEIVEGIVTIEQFLKDFRPKKLSDVTSSLVPIVRPIATFNKQLNDMEISKLIELNQAADDLIDVVKSHATRFFELKNLYDLYNKVYPLDVFDLNVRAAIKFCKGISKFKEVSESDRTVLFKNSCWKIIMLKKIPSFNFESEHWTYSLVSAKLSPRIISMDDLSE